MGRPLVLEAQADHKGHGGAQAEFYKRSEAWLAAMVTGQPAPVK